MTSHVIDYDSIENWAPSLTASLDRIIQGSPAEVICAERPEYIEDARDLVFEVYGRETVIDATLEWISSNSFAAYHGSRLTPEELNNVMRSGLVPLCAEARRARLVRALSLHPCWSSIEPRLDATIEAYGRGAAMGRREGQVHLTLSKAGLTEGFSHYLKRGSEFDQRVASALLGHEGDRLLEVDGESFVIKVLVPGSEAIKATHPYFTVDDKRSRGDVPNLVNEFLCAWSFRFFRPEFQPRTLMTDCGLVFSDTVPAEWICGVERWTP